MSEFILGKNSIIEALKSGRPINKIFIAKGLHGIEEVVNQVRQKKILYEFLDRSELDRIAKNAKHQGLIATVSPAIYVSVEEIMAVAESKKEPLFIILLDGLEDPHNLGAILRTADAAGAHGVVIPKRRAAPLTDTVSKSSAGAVEYVPVARVSNLNDVIRKLKDSRVWVVGLDEKADKEFTKADFKLPTALVVGGEGEGLSRLVKENCDYLVNLPMKGKISSLNASVSAAVVMYEVVRQRI
ncbi:23S rRNA (guanosine(2251)-2'-O)-methyltransferase RlmB [candidate division WOR-1 bacterium RIFOXYC2_FULL_37_10]|uniref:23S rRNA (Guanosine(2251)-2'-O)-methyltransferase RlmB n=1 Tax=candidate division WOR-1 bacterium RIFOXYB2_FULL_37_13 TaxID=1802579 RepID=A0A1F4SHK3_UNCSA|nr:MAG: 23S rRNA (guanosine(2251)-2'-O)-methyltransferase RlmB [candidate division WOR-1 bacterium RIFOXYB2_FULL_37_13]OGC36995.1 MAG: 23S rRNA (guanosine(2251)-2'-O)-methyltransferase RlmB [candidate division WOR-1 bacterium RIFOXYC2_FULL_37_10]